MDDHAIVRYGLAALIDSTPGLRTCGVACDSVEAMRVARDTNPQLALIDIVLRSESGLDLCKSILAAHPGLRVIVLSVHDEELFIDRCLGLGACGYVRKDAPVSELIEAIRVVMSGSLYFKADASALPARNGSGRAGAVGLGRLSDRELFVLQLIGSGSTAAEISARLGITPKTVDAHRTHIKKKLGVKSASELLRYAVRALELGGVPRPDSSGS